MADFNTTVTVMLFEGGALCQALPSHDAGIALTDKIMEADEAALADGKPTFDLALSPFEVGMALAAATANQSALGQSLGQKISQALAAKLQELGISLDGSQQGGGLNDAPATDTAPADSAPADSSEPSADQPASDESDDSGAL